MRLAVPKETAPGERRVALVPESCKKLIAKGIDVVVEAGAGAAAYFADEAYLAVGAKVERDPGKLLETADFIAKVQPPRTRDDGFDETAAMPAGALLLAALLPVKNLDAVRQLAEQKVTAFSTDAIPRTTRAQSMDTLSSMANIAGYKAVLIAAAELPKYFPMFMTAAGTVFAAKVFVIGAGVAGLQAIATAKRLGAIVEATDTRPSVREEVQSCGGKFVGIQTDESAQDAGGYAKELSADFYRKQAELIADRCAHNDVVITTALIGGVKAPRLITAEMVSHMRPGSVIVDLAAEAGGNCELTEPGETAVHHGVKIIGPLNLPSEMAEHASLLFSRNIATFVLEFCKDGKFQLNLEDEILAGALVTHQGDIRHALTRNALAAPVG